jgi:hypothetical protein
VRRALALASLARTDAVLVDATTQQAIDSEQWPLDAADDVVGLDGAPMQLYALRAADPADA